MTPSAPEHLELRRLSSLAAIADFYPVHKQVVDSSAMLSINEELVSGGRSVREMSDGRRKALFLAQLKPRELTSKQAFVGAYLVREVGDDGQAATRTAVGYALFDLPPSFPPFAGDDSFPHAYDLPLEFASDEQVFDLAYVERREEELRPIWDQALEGRESWYLDRLYVSPSHQGKGIGSNLLQWGTDQADERGECILLLTTPEGRPLYHKKHFRPVSDAADDPHLFREPTDVQLRGLLTSLSPPKAKLHRLPPFHLHLTTSRGSAGSR